MGLPGVMVSVVVAGIGPYRANGDVATGAITPEVENIGEANKPNDFFKADATATVLPIWTAKTTTDTITPGKTMLLMNGRRYKVASFPTTPTTSALVCPRSPSLKPT